MTTEIRLPMPHAGQQAVQRAKRRINWLVAGRRWRKTTMLMELAIEPAVLRHQQIVWGAPTHDQCMLGWSEVRKAAGAAADFNLGRREITFPGGGKIIFRSLDDPDNARGWTADRILVDEAPEVKDWAWSTVLRALISDTQGDAWLVGSPKGMNWYHEEWAMAHDGRAPDSAAWQAPTLGARIEDGALVREPHPLENPEFSWDELQMLFATTPREVFAQEFLAQFVDAGDAVFDSVDVLAMRPDWSGLRGPESAHQYMTAWDIGRKRDPTWGITVDWTKVPYQIVASERVLGVPFPRVQEMIAERATLYPGTTIVESNGIGDPVIQNLSVYVDEFVTTARSKVDALNALRLLLQDRGLRGYIPQLEHELLAYRWDDRALTQDGVMVLAMLASRLPSVARSEIRYVESHEFQAANASLLGGIEVQL